MIIGGIIVSSVEFPGKISLVIFTGGCTLKCPYCHNPELIDGGEKMDINRVKAEIFDALEFIDGVVITGGEPLMQFEDVRELLKYSKELGLKVKLDTNGCFPEELKKIIKWIDYIALDIKAPFDKYKEIIKADIGKEVKRSMEIAIDSPDTYLECRTTYVPGILDGLDFLKIAENIKCDLFTIQQFRNKVVLDDKLKKTPNPSRDELLKIAREVKPFLGRVNIKTAEFGVEIIK